MQQLVHYHVSFYALDNGTFVSLENMLSDSSQLLHWVILAYCEIWYGLHWLGAASHSIKHTAVIYWYTTVKGRDDLKKKKKKWYVQERLLLRTHYVFFSAPPPLHIHTLNTHSQLEAPQFSLSPALLALLQEQLRLSMVHKGSSETILKNVTFIYAWPHCSHLPGHFN